MNWLAPILAIPKGRAFDRHRRGYFRDYYAKNIAKLRAYYARKAREYRRAA